MIQSCNLLSLVVKFALLFLLLWTTNGYSIDHEYSNLQTLRLVDVQTKSSPLSLLFVDKKTAVLVESLSWTGNASTASLKYTTFLNDEEVASGSITLSSDALELPHTINAGTIAATDAGSNFIRVVLNDGSMVETSVDMTVRAYNQWYAIIPIIASFVSFLLFNLQMEVSLFLAIFSGSWIIKGSFYKGFSAIFENYLVEAVSERSHAAM